MTSAQSRKREGLFVAPLLMLVFAAVATWFGVTEVLDARANPTPTEVACERAAIQAVGAKRWVFVGECEADWNAAVERKVAGAEKRVVPLRRAGSTDGEVIAIGLVNPTSRAPATVEGMTAPPVDGLPAIELGDRPSTMKGLFFLAAGVGLLVAAAIYFRRARQQAAELDAQPVPTRGGERQRLGELADGVRTQTTETN